MAAWPETTRERDTPPSINGGWAVAALAVWIVLLIVALRWLKRAAQARFIRHKLLRTRPLAGDRRVIAAFSTLPDRIWNLQPTIECLLHQTRVPDEIIVALPRFSRRQQRRYVVPEYLAEMPRVRLLECDTDWGPATKFIPVIQSELEAGHDDSLIMIVDDDRIYPNDALETYLCYHRELPDAALCFRGAPMPNDFVWRHARMVRGAGIREPRRVAVITGCGSYFIQPRFFDAELWNYSESPPGAFYMDDIWISGCLDRRGVKKYAIPTSAMMRTARQQRGTMTLHDIPEGRQYHNDEAIAFFGKTWDVFGPSYRGIARLCCFEPPA
jgi:hypothetical protein